MNRPENCLRLVVKVGTSTLTQETGSLNLRSMDHLARVLSDLRGPSPSAPVSSGWGSGPACCP